MLRNDFASNVLGRKVYGSMRITYDDEEEGSAFPTTSTGTCSKCQARTSLESSCSPHSVHLRQLRHGQGFEGISHGDYR
jgi:hypothetical protein